jgi:TPR repeat protein
MENKQELLLVENPERPMALVPGLHSSLISRGRQSAEKLWSNPNELVPVDRLLALAEDGNADAQYLLGKRFETENSGEPTNNASEMAAHWLRRAAEQDHPQAQFAFGALHSAGVGVPQDEEQLVYWWRKSADSGFAVAQYELGYLYLQGWGVRQDVSRGIALMQRAAESGDRSAPYALAHIYENGAGVDRDYERAAYWQRIEADRGSKTAQHRLGQMYREGLGVQQDFEQAERWLRRSALQDYGEAQFDLGLLYASTEGSHHNDQEAIFWLWLAEDKERRSLPRKEEARAACTEVSRRLRPEQSTRAAERVSEWLQRHSRQA